MKRLPLILMLFIAHYSYAQIGIGTSSPHESAIVELQSTNKGFLPPRLNNEQLKKVENPAAGLMVYCSDCCYDNRTLMVRSVDEWISLSGQCTPCESTLDLFSLQDLNSASNIIGQPNATSSNATTSASTVPLAYYMALDKITGKVFISQTQPSNRISRYSSLESFLFNQPAEMVFGRSNLTTSGNSVTVARNTLRDPKGMQIDRFGNLWVVDALHNRILKYNNAATTSNQPDAELVLGQSNFTSSGTNENSPTGGYDQAFQLVIDEANNMLWVNSRHKVFGYKNYHTITNNGHPADIVLGTNSFTNDLSGSATQSTFNNVKGLAFIDGTLYVADAGNHRVLRFNDAHLKSNGANADEVYFQSNFTNNSSGNSLSKINKPFLISSDEKGNLYVSEDGNHRVSVIEDIQNKDRTAVSTHTFGTGSAGTSATTLKNPRGVNLFEFNGQKLIAIADKTNNRVVIYGPDKLEITEGQNSSLGILSGVTLASDNLTYAIVSQPDLGQVSINSSTGELTFDATSVNISSDTPTTFVYSITNDGGCVRNIEQSVLIKNI